MKWNARSTPPSSTAAVMNVTMSRGVEKLVLPGVTQVHDLHIWAISTTENALTAHLVRPGAGLDDHHFTTEVGAFNMELNLDPQVFTGGCLSTVEAQIDELRATFDARW